MIGVLLALTIGAAAWYFLARDTGPDSAFVRAEERYVAAVEDLADATSQVTFARGDPRYDLRYEDTTARMEAQLAVFQRLASSEDGEAADLASDASQSAELGLSAADALHRALYRTDITDADRAREQLADATSRLVAHARAWKQL